MPYCQSMQFIEFPGLCNSETFDLGDITLYLRSFYNCFNPLLVLDLGSDLNFEELGQLWNVLNESNQVVPVVITKVGKWLRTKSQTNGEEENVKFRRIKQFFKKKVRKESEDTLSTSEKVNAQMKKLLLEVGLHLHKFQVFVYDKEGEDQWGDATFWYSPISN